MAVVEGGPTSDTDGHRAVVVIGAGVAGLTAAWDLRDLDVLVLESGERVGGRIRSERRGDYWLNFGAHVFSGAGSETDRLLGETGVRAAAVPGRLTALALRGRLLTSGRWRRIRSGFPSPPQSGSP